MKGFNGFGLLLNEVDNIRRRFLDIPLRSGEKVLVGDNIEHGNSIIIKL